jgi:type II secretory pathway component PulL
MSTLLIRCPLKPFAGAFTGLAGEWEDLACAQRFEWCLVEDADALSSSITSASTSPSASTLTSTLQSGIGSIDSMPYADEALVLLPTLDVRLIETKVPLANPKKLQAILPTLLEEYVLSSTATLHIGALPPVPGQPAMDRTLAAIDRAWFTWITGQLEGVLSNRVRLIPDCLLLPLEGDGPSLMRVREGDANVYCQRTGMQTGVAWAEYSPLLEAEIARADHDHDQNHNHNHNSDGTSPLPSHLGASDAVPFAWAWAAPSAMAFLEANASSRAPNFALNLLPSGFKSRAGGLARSTASSNTGKSAGTNAIALAWVDPLTWQPALRWMGLGIATIALGFLAQLAWLGVSNWRWGQQMELLAMQSLTPANMSRLSQGANQHDVLPVFLDQTINTQRSQGAVTDADFASLAAKLQQLSSALNVKALQQINYSANTMEFEFKAGGQDFSSTEAAQRVIASARNLGLMVKHLGGARYRLEAYAGLGAQP